MKGSIRPNGPEIRRRRQSIGWSQAAAAKRSGVDVKTIQRWETKSASAYPSKLEKLAEALGCTVRDLSGEDRTPATAAAVAALHQLPVPPADFVGRSAERDALVRAVDNGAAVAGVRGTGGVGKTALALVCAHQLTERYPDAQVFLDLRGADGQEPLTPVEVLTQVIRAIEPTAELPQDETALAGLYRSLLHGKRALLLFDNARDADQVRPLVPPAGCLLLLTSRQRFALPGYRPLRLDQLSAADARALLRRLVPRVGADAGRVARLCGHLPLALRAAASVLAERADLDVEHYLNRYLETFPLLDLVDETAGRSLQTTLELSYEALPSVELQQRWRALAVFPATFSLGAAAAVWQVDEDRAAESLGALLRYSLLEWDETARRYRLHDLVRLVAGARLAGGEEIEGRRRHSVYYRDLLAEADRLYRQGGDSIPRGLTLFDREWPNVEAGRRWAEAHADDDADAAELLSSYPDAGIHFLSLRLHPDDWIRWLERALVVLRQTRDRSRAGTTLCSLACAHYTRGEYRKAIDVHEQALATFRELDDRKGEADSLNNLGSTYHCQAEYRKALDLHQRALVIFRTIGDSRGEASALNNMGCTYVSLGQYQKAAELHAQQRAIFHELGDRYGEATSLNNLGALHHSLDEHGEAIACYGQSRAIAHELGDRRGEAASLNNMGSTYQRQGKYQEAVDFYAQSLAIFRELGDRYGEATALNNLGRAYHAQGEYRKAIDTHRQSLAIKRQLGDRHGEADSLYNEALALDELNRRSEAVPLMQAALADYRRSESPEASSAALWLARWSSEPLE